MWKDSLDQWDTQGLIYDFCFAFDGKALLTSNRCLWTPLENSLPNNTSWAKTCQPSNWLAVMWTLGGVYCPWFSHFPLDSLISQSLAVHPSTRASDNSCSFWDSDCPLEHEMSSFRSERNQMTRAEIMSHPIVIIYSFGKKENASFFFHCSDCQLRNCAYLCLLNKLMCYSCCEQKYRRDKERTKRQRASILEVDCGNDVQAHHQ